MKSYLVILVFFSLFVGIVHAGEPNAVEYLPSLIKTAHANNPELKSSQARWRMFASKAKQASALEDPMFMFKLQNMLAREPFRFQQGSPVRQGDRHLPAAPVLGQTGYQGGGCPV